MRRFLCISVVLLLEVVLNTASQIRADKELNIFIRRGPPPAKESEEEEASPGGSAGRIVGGQVAEDGKYPYYVKWAPSRYSGTTRALLCGASLIHEDIVLSAAHCHIDNDNNDVVLGAFAYYGDQSSVYDESLARTIVRRKVHPDYQHGESFQYDFIVMKLDRPAPFGMEPVGLNQEFSVPADYEDLTVMGFGRTAYGGPISLTLMETSVTKYPEDVCLEPYSDVHFFPDAMFCAGTDSGGVGTCQGDSGGPGVVIDASSDPIQVGVISWGTGCGLSDYPSVFARVSDARDWIWQTVCELSENKPLSCPEPPTGARLVTMEFNLGSEPQATEWSLTNQESGDEILSYPSRSFWESGLNVDTVHLVPGSYAIAVSALGSNGSFQIYVEGDGGPVVLAAGNGSSGSQISLFDVE